MLINLNNIKVIFWDIDGTLLDFEYAEKASLYKLFKKYNLGHLDDEMVERYSNINHEYWKKLEKGEITKKEVLLNRFLDFFNLYGIDTSVVEAFNSDYQVSLGEFAEFNPHGKEVVEYFAGEVLQVGVTNGSKIAQNGKLKLSGLDKLLDYVFISEDIGVEKPNVEFFDKVFKEIGTYPKNQMIIIGDSLTSDIQSGNNLGILTCWYNKHHEENKLGLRVDFEVDDLDNVKYLI